MAGKKNELIIYLAGAFCPYTNKEPYVGKMHYSDWRDFVINGVNNNKINFYDPRTESNQLCPATFTMDDARGVLNSDILLHYRTSGYEDDGASWEHGIAFACNLSAAEKEKLILYVDDTKAPFPLHFGSANVTLTSLETAVDFLDNIKSIEKEHWLKVYVKILDKDRAGN